MSGVVITGTGAICALGDKPSVIHAALCAGVPAFAPSAIVPADVVPGHHVAEIRDFDAQKYLGAGNIRPLDRTGRIAAVGVELTLADAGWTKELRQTRAFGLILGTMFCSVRTISEFDRRAQQAGVEYASPMDFSNTVLNAAAGQVAIWHKLRGVNSTIAAGASSGLHAVGYAAKLIRTGRADALVAGGAEEICFESLLGFSRAGFLAAPDGNAPGCSVPFDKRRRGAALGEGAAFLALESESAAQSRGAKVLGRVLGFGAAYDAGARVNGGGTAAALTHAITRALKDAGAAPGDIGVVSASAHGGRTLDAREASAIASTVGSSVPVTAVKAGLGEMLGAAGPMQTAMALESMRTGTLPGVTGLGDLDPEIRLAASASSRPLSAKRALVTAIAPEGNCCALVVSLD
jgi:3-oxoacyl-[acyl-carrier-protein] synthase II